MSRVTTFKTPLGEELVVLSAAEYERLCEAVEMAEDIAAYDEVKRKLAIGEEEMIPSEMVDRLVEGENPVRVWREYRGMTAKALAEQAGISAAYLSQIENGVRDGSFETMRRIARALKLTLDDLA